MWYEISNAKCFQIQTSDTVPVTTSKINRLSTRRITLIYQNTDTIHRVDNKRILDVYYNSLYYIVCNVSNDLRHYESENYPCCIHHWYILENACVFIVSHRIDRQNWTARRPICIKSSYRGNPLSKTEQNMFLEVMVYKTQYGKTKKSLKYTHCFNSK